MTVDLESNMWFTASLLFKAEHKGVEIQDPLWEEQIVLFQAEESSIAEARAAAYGKAQEHEYANMEGQLIRWVFKKVERVCSIETTALADGTELFSRFLKDSEVQSLFVPFAD
jgi:hypothetical protein